VVGYSSSLGDNCCNPNHHRCNNRSGSKEEKVKLINEIL